jgi:hypothetical protein
MLSQIEPHRSYLETGLPSHIFVRFDDLHSLIEREGLQLEGGLGHERYGAMEKITPGLMFELFKETVPNRVRKKPQSFQDDAVLEHYHVAPVVREDGLVHQSFEN